MGNSLSRRRFLQRGAAVGSIAGLGNLSFIASLPSVSAADVAPAPGLVRVDSSIEPLVRLIEETPRAELLEEIASRIHSGTSYREILAALQLAGVRHIEPRPSVGFKFHAVLVVNSAHLASMSSPPEHRWLPIFWALDYYKSAAARDVQERGDWTMAPVAEDSLPSARRAPQVFVEAMENWDEEASDTSAAALARSAGANEVYEMFFRLGARDFRSIGHKAIFVANSYRTLQCISWQHAEPIVRSLAYALLNHDGDNPAQSDYEADRPFRRNQELAEKIPDEWLGGTVDAGATAELLQTLRTGSNDETCDLVVEQLGRGVATQSIWDALHVGAGELLMRQPGIVALHAVTTTNALQFAFLTSGNDETRRLLLLQNAAFLPMFRGAMQGRGNVGDVSIADLETGELATDDRPAVADIFADLSRDPTMAAQKVVTYLRQSGSAEELMEAARVLIFLKGRDAHDYKFSSAVLEDYYHVSPKFRDVYMAANMFKLRGSQGADNSLVERTRAALAG